MNRPPFDLKTVLGFSAMLTVSLFLLSAQSPATPSPASRVSSEALDAAVKSYNDVQYSAPPLELCEKADEIALAYLQAYDRAGYQAWDSVGENHCRAAGFADEEDLPHDS